MATVTSVTNPSVSEETPFLFTIPGGVTGWVTTIMLNEEEVVVMVFDDAVDQVGNNVTVKHPIDVSEYWTLTSGGQYEDGDFNVIGSMTITYEGQTYTLQHNIHYLSGGWWLTRKASDGEYAASGKNILSYFGSTYSLPDGFTLDDIESGNTDLDGLKKPENFPSVAFLSVLGSDYELVGDNTFRLKSGGGETTPGDSNIVDLTSKTETGDNTNDFSAHFKSVWDYTKFIAVAGFQANVFRGQSGLLEHFKAGWNYLDFKDYYPVSQSLGEGSQANFSMFQWDLTNGNINSAANGLTSTFPDMRNAIISRDFTAANSQSQAAWEVFAGHISSYLLYYNDLAGGTERWAGFTLLDEESNVHLTANGGLYEKIKFIAKTCEYVVRNRPGSIVVHYGYPCTTVHWQSSMWYKNTDLTALRTELPMGVPKPSTTYYFDGTITYVKSPLPVVESIYKKNTDGSYILSGGKRQLRTDRFSETYLGVRNTWHPSMYNPQYDDYTPIPDGNGGYINEGYINSFTGVKVTDMEYAVAFPYRYMAIIKTTMGIISNAEGHGFDTTRLWDSVYKPIAVMALLTEPITTGGNGFYRRWVGEDQIKFLLIAPVISGYAGDYVYKDGFLGTVYYNPDTSNNPNTLPLQLPTKGNTIEPWWFFENFADFGVSYTVYENYNSIDKRCNQNISRDNFATTSISSLRDITSYYTNNNTLRFLFFNVIGGGIDEREVIMSGRYQGSHMHIMAYYPFSDKTDTISITFYIGGNTYVQTLRPRMCEIYYFNGLFSSLNPVDIKAQYNNIDGDLIKVTGDHDNHTW